MNLYSNNIRCSVQHIIDRLPETEMDLKYVQKMFPGTIVIRKNNGKAILFEEAKIKNLHWYK